VADRTSANLFATLFELCAKRGAAGKEIAMEMWKLRRGYDFSDYQVAADKAMMKLGLAKEIADPEGGSKVVYLQSDGTWE
jgi:hypothetical protein